MPLSVTCFPTVSAIAAIVSWRATSGRKRRKNSLVQQLQTSLEPKPCDTSPEALKINAEHLRIAAQFEYRNMARLVLAAEGYPLCRMFNKSHKIAGDETYEALVKLHMDTLSENDISEIEDKILLKRTAKALGVSTTECYYSAHKHDYNPIEMRTALSKAIANGKTSYIVKPTHMAWSKGILVVRDQDKDLDYVEAHIQHNILDQHDDGADSAHLLTLEPGVVIEEYFGKQPGAPARIPLECKCQMIWGEVHHAWFVGQDLDGSTLHPDAMTIFGDGSSWGVTESRAWIVREGHWKKIVEQSQRMARGLGADFIRVDFFLTPGSEPCLNEVECVNGNVLFKMRKSVGEAWRLGYVASGNFELDADKVVAMKAHVDRDRRNEQIL